MAKETNLDFIFRITSKLPRRLSIGFAFISFVVLHYVTQIVQPNVTQLSQMSDLYTSTLIHMFAVLGQYIVPLIFIFAALARFLRDRKVTERFELTAELKDKSALLNMNWRQFEALVGELFKRQGFQVSLNDQSGPDGGVDIELRKGSELSLVQCKQWRGNQVSVTTVRELYGVMAARGATSGYVVSAGSFTADASEFSIGRNITLINGHELVKQMNEVVRHRASDKKMVKEEHDPFTPLCPTCGRSMVKRTAASGRQKGKMFWGCPAFPNCRGTRSIT